MSAGEEGRRRGKEGKELEFGLGESNEIRKEREGQRGKEEE